MTLLRKIDKVLASLGNIGAMKRTHVDSYTQGRMDNIEGTKIAESGEGQLWVRFQELAGHLFLNASILSHDSLKTTRGVRLTIDTGNRELQLASDEPEVHSDYSNITGTYLTELSFIVSAQEQRLMLSKAFKTITVTCKKKQISMKPVSKITSSN